MCLWLWLFSSNKHARFDVLGQLFFHVTFHLCLDFILNLTQNLRNTSFTGQWNTVCKITWSVLVFTVILIIPIHKCCFKNKLKCFFVFIVRDLQNQPFLLVWAGCGILKVGECNFSEVETEGGRWATINYTTHKQANCQSKNIKFRHMANVTEWGFYCFL